MSKTIKERHLEAIVMENTITSTKAYDYAAERCEAITEDVCIKLMEWLIKNNMSPDGFGGWGGGKINTNLHGSKSVQLLKLFKKETEL